MSTTTLTSKGQVTLPKEIRDRLGLKSGDKFSCRIAGDDEIVIRRKVVDVSELVGLLHVPGKRATIEAMNEAVKDAAVARGTRGLRRPWRESVSTALSACWSPTNKRRAAAAESS